MENSKYFHFFLSEYEYFHFNSTKRYIRSRIEYIEDIDYIHIFQKC